MNSPVLEIIGRSFTKSSNRPDTIMSDSDNTVPKTWRISCTCTVVIIHADYCEIAGAILKLQYK